MYDFNSDVMSQCAQYEDGTEHINSNRDWQNKTCIHFVYATGDVLYYDHIPLMSFSDFVSAIGGNVGVFVDFSVMSFLFAIYDLIYTWVFKRWPRRGPNIDQLGPKIMVAPM